MESSKLATRLINQPRNEPHESDLSFGSPLIESTMRTRLRTADAKHRSRDSFGLERQQSQPLIVAADVCFWATFLVTTTCFGGRAAVGQFALVVGATITAGCWLLHQLTSREARYTWSGSELLWLLGIAVGVGQIVPLPREYLLMISPELGKILSSSNDEVAKDLGLKSWNQLSLAPWESASGLAIFVAYALLFAFLVQRLKTRDDVERLIPTVGLVVVAMAVFALIQWLAGNGKFYWVYEHPYMTTDGIPHGSFTNRNHLAQFLALGVGPLIWCVLRRLPRNDLSEADSTTLTERRSPAMTIALLLGLVCTIVTALATSSRGGLLAIGVVLMVSMLAMLWLRIIPAELCVGLVAVACVIGGIVNLTGSEAAMEDRLKQSSGREQVWQANIAVARDFPYLGTGVGTHVDAHQLHLEKPLDGHEFTHAESSYLQVASETGLIGLGVAALFILASLRWCLSALFCADKRVSSLAAAVLASLLGNLAHAVGDFFWYTPSCMLLLAIQLACVCRLRHITREEAGGTSFSWRLPRLLCVPALGGVAVVAVWMVAVKLPSALAEPEQMQYISLLFAEATMPGEDEDRQDLRRDKWQAAIRAARLNPHNSKFLETAGLTYLERFNTSQSETENSIPLGQLRDAIKASEFESPEAMHEWLDRAVGKNIKLLRLAKKYLRQSLKESPLRVHAYLELVELGFLDSMSAEAEDAYLKQALVLRPHDPGVLFAVGRHLSLSGDVDAAMPYWSKAFTISPEARRKVTALLAPQMSAADFLTKLEPDWSSLPDIARAFDQSGRKDEGQQIWQKCIDDSPSQSKVAKSRTERDQVLLTLCDAYTALEQQDRALAMLSKAHRQSPDNMQIRIRLAWGLYHAQRFSDAADHFIWLSTRLPGDKSIQDAAAKTTKERMRTAGGVDSPS